MSKGYLCTVYDPLVISDEQMIKYGQEAMRNGIINGTIKDRKITGIASNGLKFEGYYSSDYSEITNFYPCF